MTSDGWTLQNISDIKTALVSGLAELKTLSNGNWVNLICPDVYFT